MPAFGAKTIADLVKDIEGDASMSTLDVTNNSSIKMKSAEALAALAPGLKAHKGIKTINFTECEITDGCCEVLADILATNHVIETVILEKNKITSTGAQTLADGLAGNKGVRTLNLLQQAVKSFGDECLDHFVLMYGTNITLTKMTWRLDSRKSFMLAKLQTRNIEIQKAKDLGKPFEHLLPDHLRSGAPPAPAAAAPVAAEEEPAPAAALAKRQSTVAEMEAHVAAISEASPEVAESVPEPAAEEAAEPAAEAPAEPAAEEAPAEAAAEAPAEAAAEAAAPADGEEKKE